MILVPDEVKCTVCKNIFCCSDCRKKHELKAHTTDEVLNERNRLKCGLCQGSPRLVFQLNNDFEFIMHLCQSHLPLHCSKCSTKFNSINDFKNAVKCLHNNGVCKLESPENVATATNESRCFVAVSLHTSKSNSLDRNYITANTSSDNKQLIVIDGNEKVLVAKMPDTDAKSKLINKPIFEREPSTSDSVVSFRNYSTILHSSNHTLFKTHSPSDMEKNLVRQTSTPMHQNVMDIKSPAPIGCRSCMVSSSQVSSIHSGSDSETSPSLPSKPTNVVQNSIIVTHKKTTTIKRSVRTKLPLAATPLRQVMSKSIHRAIREHVATEIALVSPRSPLDLRMSPVIRRYLTDSAKTDLPSDKYTPELNDINAHLSTSASAPKSDGVAGKSLETVYENAKIFGIETVDECNEQNKTNHQIEAQTKLIAVKNPVNVTSKHEAIKDTSVDVSPTKTGDNKSNENITDEIWYTPREHPLAKPPTKQPEMYTPVLKIGNWQNKRRSVLQKTNSVDDSTFLSAPVKSVRSNSEPINRSSKFWSFVSSVLRFASLTPNTDNIKPAKTTTVNAEIGMNTPNSTPIIKRCASFAGVLHDKNISSPLEHNHSDNFQANKRRRTTTVNMPLMDDEKSLYTQRIKCRRPIPRMRKN